MIELFLAQLTDPFRIVLAIGLVITMLRTRAATGTWLPLAAGVGFIAVLIPTVMQRVEGDLIMPVAVGLVSTAVIVGVALAVSALVQGSRGR